MPHDDDACIPSVPVAELRGHRDGPIHIVRFTADGKYCITGGNDRTVRLWNPTRIDPAYRRPLLESSRGSSTDYYRAREPTAAAQTEEPPSALPMQTYAEGHMHPVYAVAANAASTTLLSGSDKTLLCTDLVTAQLKQKWWGHVARIDHVACLGGGSDGTNGNAVAGDDVYASASYDATVRLWDSRSRAKEPLMVLDDAKDAVTCVAPMAGEPCIVTSSVDGKIRIYDLRKAQLMTQDVRHPITSVSFGFDGTTCAASCLDGNIRLWDVHTGTTNPTKISQNMHSFHKSGNYKLDCAFTSNDRCIVSGSECGAVVVYPLQDPSASWSHERRQPTTKAKGIKLQRHTGPTCSVAACPHSSRPWLVLSASYDGRALVWASQEQAERCLEN